ncbi:MAG: MFS transporter [Planctomycetota bacterium]
MTWRWRLYVITFVESVASILLERGIYFLTTDRLAFGDAANLWIALAFGVAYGVGALASHPIADRIGERRLLMASIVGLAVLHLLLAVWPTAWGIAVMFPAVALVTGLKWPVIESYVGAGLDERQTRHAFGRFNLTWSTAVPLTIGGAGLLTAYLPSWVFFAIVVPMHVASLVLVRGVPDEPEHAPLEPTEAGSNGVEIEQDEEVIDPSAAAAAGRWRLLWASRWLLVGSYAMSFLITPLIPQILGQLGRGPATAGWVAALLDVARVVAFIGMVVWGGWHGRAWPIVAGMVALPVGVALVLFGGTIGAVVAGELLFGLAMGGVYTTALYYAMVAKKASVDAGGSHEALIGGGFAIGPAIGLIGLAMASPMGGPIAGMLVGLGPWVVAITLLAGAGLGGVWPRQSSSAVRG